MLKTQFVIKDKKANEFHTAGGRGFKKTTDRFFAEDIHKAYLHTTKASAELLVKDYQKTLGTRSLEIVPVQVIILEVL